MALLWYFCSFAKEKKMELQSFQYTLGSGWSIPSFPEMDSENTLILVFAAPEFIENPAPIKELAAKYPKSKMIGCSSAGEISGSYIYDKSLAVAIARFDKTSIEIVKKPIERVEDSYKAGEEIAKKLKKEDLRGIFVLSEGLKVNGSELVKGLNTLAKEQVVITGGLAGDGHDFKNTWAIFNGQIVTDHIVAVAFYGESIVIGHASKGGWDIFGLERRITKSKNNILYELDQKPALKLYKEYLGERAAELPASGLLYPLAIRKDAEDARQLVRTILAVDEATQSLTFAGDVPEGYLAQLMRANFDRLITSASEAGELATGIMLSQHNKATNVPVLSVAVSCVGRRLVLGERAEEETEAILATLPPGTQQIGFYSYGELSPYTVGTCDLHNQTMTITTFYER
jgi:hypothetical protein